ncbi:hypothetical protein RLOatenuis_5010 [Rickettsiales bacterium]|nr:hypothetical protein RLOatenuis_5010 [Rickettsiales bacterium]
MPYAQQVSGSCLANIHPHIPIYDIDYSEAKNEENTEKLRSRCADCIRFIKTLLCVYGALRAKETCINLERADAMQRLYTEMDKVHPELCRAQRLYRGCISGLDGATPQEAHAHPAIREGELLHILESLS